MRILITGNMGYVGPLVAKHLRTRFPQAFLAGYDTGYFAHCLTSAEQLPESRLDRQYFGDVRTFDPQVLSGFDGVVHLAALSNDPMGSLDESLTLRINFEATRDVARAAKAAGVKSFVFASSCSVYGFSDEEVSESSSLNPLTAYARSKALAEEAILGLADDSFRVTALRFATATGMSDRLRLDLVLNDFVANALASGEIVILSDGTPWRPLIDVADMARAIEWGLTRTNGVNGLVVNAGSDSWNYTVRQLAETVEQLLPNIRTAIQGTGGSDKRSYRVSFKKYRELAPQHQPARTLESTIQRLYAGLSAMKFADKDFRNSSLIRLRVLSGHKASGLLDDSLFWKDRKLTKPLGAVEARDTEVAQEAR